LYLLDTNVISELRRARPHGGVVGWIEATGARLLYLPAVVLAELQAGIEITRVRNPTRASELGAWLNEIADSWSILPMDGAAFREWARLMHGKSDELYEDAMIAATARIHGFIVATRNSRDFVDFGVQVFNPWNWRG
jgi:predicted nucleic acid-binding protein